jgi:triacylglycerol lipase
MSLRSSAFAAAICVLAGAAPAAAADPPLTVSKAKLDAALNCHGKLQGAERQPIMLVTGTGATGDEPSLRAKVTDVLAAAGTQHGTALGDRAACAASGCAPAVWQQLAGSKLLAALNAEPDETPGPTAWTTVRSSGDETVQPQTGPHPTSALRGATNVLIQSLCPGRVVSHIGTALDSVTFAAFADALAHRGAARIARLPKDVCAHPYAPGLDEAGTSAVLGASGNLIAPRLVSQVPRVTAEPPVRAYAHRTAD